MKIGTRIQLALLRGRDNTLHHQIAAGYARGDYASQARAEQQKIRAQIRAIEEADRGKA